MKQFLLLASTLLLASCVSIERDNPDDLMGSNYKGITYEGETYYAVVIGTQTWFKRNLNYDVEGSKCYQNEETNCAIYGRLYDWTTAMALPASCNTNSCASQIKANHKGICPEGWHIPSDVDWSILMRFVNSSCSNNSSCSDAATKLKATSGWSNRNGQDTYGFSALPGGNGVPASNIPFDNVGYSGNWWSSYEGSAGSAFYRSMGGEDVLWSNGNKSTLYSVRCLQD